MNLFEQFERAILFSFFLTAIVTLPKVARPSDKKRRNLFRPVKATNSFFSAR